MNSLPCLNSKGDRRLSPVVMRLIGEHNINIDELDGGGFNGRITKKDVEKYLADGPVKQAEPVQQTQSKT